MSRWSKLYDACRICGTTDRPHAGHGLCSVHYYRQHARIKGEALTESRRRARQARREEIYAGQRRAIAKKPDYYRQYKTEWQRMNKGKWPVGAPVYVKFGSFEFVGEIVSTRPGKPWTASVKMPLGTVLEKVPTTDLRRVSA